MQVRRCKGTERLGSVSKHTSTACIAASTTKIFYAPYCSVAIPPVVMLAGRSKDADRFNWCGRHVGAPQISLVLTIVPFLHQALTYPGNAFSMWSWTILELVPPLSCSFVLFNTANPISLVLATSVDINIVQVADLLIRRIFLRRLTAVSL